MAGRQPLFKNLRVIRSGTTSFLISLFLDPSRFSVYTYTYLYLDLDWPPMTPSINPPSSTRPSSSSFTTRSSPSPLVYLALLAATGLLLALYLAASTSNSILNFRSSTLSSFHSKTPHEARGADPRDLQGEGKREEIEITLEGKEAEMATKPSMENLNGACLCSFLLWMLLLF